MEINLDAKDPRVEVFLANEKLRNPNPVKNEHLATGVVDMNRVQLIPMSHLIPKRDWDFDECPSVLCILEKWDIARMKFLTAGSALTLPSTFFPLGKEIAFLGNVYETRLSSKGNGIKVLLARKGLWKKITFSMYHAHHGPISKYEPLVPVVITP